MLVCKVLVRVMEVLVGVINCQYMTVLLVVVVNILW